MGKSDDEKLTRLGILPDATRLAELLKSNDPEPTAPVDRRTRKLPRDTAVGALLTHMRHIEEFSVSTDNVESLTEITALITDLISEAGPQIYRSDRERLHAARYISQPRARDKITNIIKSILDIATFASRGYKFETSIKGWEETKKSLLAQIENTTEVQPRETSIIDEIDNILASKGIDRRKRAGYLRGISSEFAARAREPDSLVTEISNSGPDKWDAATARAAKESPAKFIKRVYKQWLDKGLRLEHVAQIDPDLVRAYSPWKSNHRNHPDDPGLPANQRRKPKLRRRHLRTTTRKIT